MATKSFDREIIIKNKEAIRLIKDELNKPECTYFSINSKIKKIDKNKSKTLSAKLLGKY